MKNHGRDGQADRLLGPAGTGGDSAMLPAARHQLDRLWRRGCAFLGCERAIMGGAMTWVSERHLVAAISNAGGFGVIASGFVLYTWLRPSGSRETPRTGSVSSGVFWGACSGFTSFIANAGEDHTFPFHHE